MTSCRLTVRAKEKAWQGEVSPWTGLVVLASLSAEPESFGELVEAVRRYLPEHDLFTNPRQQTGEEIDPAGSWCLIDLVGRTVVAGGGFDLPDPRGAYEADPDDDAEGFPIVWLDTPKDWLFRQAADDWRALVAKRAAAKASTRRVDARAVLLGRPMLEHLADSVLAAVALGVVDKQREQELTRAIHSRWLLTAREDLGGRTPREVLMAEQSRIDLDLQHRSEQWSQQGHPAPPLPADSPAYRLGGFGTTEAVLCFDLVRGLLAEAWELTRQQPVPTQPALVEQLAAFRDHWLQVPNDANGPFPPVYLIESERRRMPVTSDGSHLDCDCPLCQLAAEGEFGPAFLCFEGHHLELEDEFAFSRCDTREEWFQKQTSDRTFSEKMDRHRREAEAGFGDADPLTGSVWQTSFVNWDALTGEGASPRRALLALGFPLTELTGNLKDRPAGAGLIRSLNRAYFGLRASKNALATHSAAQKFREALEAVSRQFLDLTPKCADLQSRLDEGLRRYG